MGQNLLDRNYSCLPKIRTALLLLFKARERKLLPPRKIHVTANLQAFKFCCTTDALSDIVHLNIYIVLCPKI